MGGNDIPSWVKSPSSSVDIELIVNKKGKIVDTVKVTPPCFILGRQSNKCDYVVAHASSSRQHTAIVTNERGDVYVIDLKSAHGTKLNDMLLIPHEAQILKSGDEIKLGASSRFFKVKLLQTIGKESSPTETHHDIPSESTKKRDRSEPLEDEDLARDDIISRYCLPVTHEVVLSGHSKTVSAIAVNPSGSRVATGSMDYCVKLWDFAGMARSVKHFREIEVEEGNPVIAVSYSPSGDKLIAATASSQPKVLDREGLELVQFVKGDMYIQDMIRTHGHTHAVTGAMWHPLHRDEMLTSSLDGTLRHWNLNGKTAFEKLQNARVWKGRSKKAGRIGITACTYQPDASMVWGATSDGQIQGFDPRKRAVSVRPERVISNASVESCGGDVGITCLTVSPNGYYMASRAADGLIKLWDLRQMTKAQNPVKVFSNIPTSVGTANCAFNGNSTSLAAPVPCDREAKIPGGLKIFDVATSQVSPVFYAPLENDKVSAVSVAWSSAINQILMGCSDGTTKVLYSPENSKKGAMLSATRKLRPTIDSSTFARIDGVGTIFNPNALPMYQEDFISTKQHQKNLERRDPKKSKMPEQPMTGPTGGGRFSSSFTEYYMQGRGKKTSMREQDPREAILSYAKSASNTPAFLGSSYVTEKDVAPQYKLASRTLEQEKIDKQKEDDELLK